MADNPSLKEGVVGCLGQGAHGYCSKLWLLHMP